VHSFAFSQSDNYPIALLVKDSAFNKQEIQHTYETYFTKHGLDSADIIVGALSYGGKKKAAVPFIKDELVTVLSELRSVAVQYIYCADAEYFKVLTNSRKADVHLGYVLPCTVVGYTDMHVVLGVNHKSLFYNPANEPKLIMSMDTLIDLVKNTYTALGTDVIQYAEYPYTSVEIAAALGKLHQYPALSCDIETASLKFNKAGIGTITFAWSKHEGIAFAVDYVSLPSPINGVYGEMVHNGPVKTALKHFFETYKGELRFHKASFDVKILIYELWMDDYFDNENLLIGLEVLTRDFADTLIIAYLATNSAAGNSLSLKDLAHAHSGNWANSEIKNILKIPLHELLKYNLIDGISTNYVYEKFYPLMVQDQQLELYTGLMLPSQQVIIQMELTGMPLIPENVAAARKELEGIIAGYEQVFAQQPTGFGESIIQKLEYRLQTEAMVAANAKLKKKQHPLSHFAGLRFNPNSNPQKQLLLYELMGLPVIDLTDTKQPACGGETLEKLVNHAVNPEYLDLLHALIGYATADKILSSFIPAFEAAVRKGDGIMWLHGCFNLGGTKSGRLSSSDPNMQNIPAGSTYGKLIKKCFGTPAGWIFGGADFNSLEDYISALTTRDPNKMRVYLEGYDGHCLRAFSYFPDRLPGIVDTVESINSIKKLYEAIRQLSKAPTFALTYRGTWRTLMANCGFTEAVAKQIERNYHELYAASDQWVQDRLTEAASCGYVKIAFGLRLRTPLIAKTVLGLRSTPFEAEAEGRTAGNALGQSYGLLNNRAANAFMKKVWKSPYRNSILPVALIHDAIYLVFEDSPEIIHWVNENLIEEMRWQELPEIQHDKVKIGAELSLFWPTWADELTLPNNASIEQITQQCLEYQAKLKEKP